MAGDKPNSSIIICSEKRARKTNLIDFSISFVYKYIIVNLVSMFTFLIKHLFMLLAVAKNYSWKR